MLYPDYRNGPLTRWAITAMIIAIDLYVAEQQRESMLKQLRLEREWFKRANASLMVIAANSSPTPL